MCIVLLVPIIPFLAFSGSLDQWLPLALGVAIAVPVLIAAIAKRH